MFWTRGLHALAAPRGDGLRQEFLELMAQREAVGAASVEEISSYLAEHCLQAGPHPAAALGAAPPAGVLLFRTPTPATQCSGPLRRPAT